MKSKSFAFHIALFAFALAAKAQSPYISRVFEYRPAPGQFVNTMPEWEEGDDTEAMRQKAEACIANHNREMITLGGWGGYVVFGFDHEVKNRRRKYDFKVTGNAFYSTTAWTDATKMAGSSEPGIVMVSRDVNGNGLPDDAWYELAGSEHPNQQTRHAYTCTYYRPSDDHVATPDPSAKYIRDTTYIRWQDSDGRTGYVKKLAYHLQDYYPGWLQADSLAFSGTRLPDNGVKEEKQYVQYCYDWGYADAHPNNTAYETGDESVPEHLRHPSEFMIDWAVDSQGQPANLPGIHFVKVYTGINQFYGSTGETSTEVADAWDLHLLDAQGNPVVQEEEEPQTSPIDLDGDGQLSVEDIKKLIRHYLTNNQ